MFAGRQNPCWAGTDRGRNQHGRVVDPGVFNKTLILLGATRLVGYLSLHIQRALVEQLLNIPNEFFAVGDLQICIYCTEGQGNDLNLLSQVGFTWLPCWCPKLFLRKSIFFVFFSRPAGPGCSKAD